MQNGEWEKYVFINAFEPAIGELEARGVMAIVLNASELEEDSFLCGSVVVGISETSSGSAREPFPDWETTCGTSPRSWIDSSDSGITLESCNSSWKWKLEKFSRSRF